VLVLFVRHAALLRPLSEAGKLRLTRFAGQEIHCRTWSLSTWTRMFTSAMQCLGEP
jgi:hypothetical protein